ncbi:hypothetical protein [Rossellomorea marisflavi]|uniref:hypothetical protein n=1 Tax=Rossellomorea marisflavi TaxID=189381 RepID=UPI001653BA8F|nr:hypothetical protein [Rossellomorea marisflavi]
MSTNTRETLINELQETTEANIRAELSVHEIYPSELITKDILINILAEVYYGEEK